MIVEELQRHVSSALESLGVKKPEVQFEHPADLAHGDYSTNVALRYAEELHLKPRELAEKIVRMIYDLGFKIFEKKIVERVKVAGAGFINFYLSKEFFAESVEKVGDEFGKNKKLGGKKVMVEYTDPNPFKEFHIGHLMSNAIGESIARIFEAQGAKVKRACYQGDVGLHVAKAIWHFLKRHGQVSNKRDLIPLVYGDDYVHGNLAYEKDPVARKEIDEINKKIFESDTSVQQVYATGRTESLNRFAGEYERLGTHFDYFFFESETASFGKQVVVENLGRVFEESNGAVVFRGEKYGLHTRVFINSQGLPTYEAKELGLAKIKHEKFPYVLSVIITGNEVNEYFRVLLKAMEFVFPDLAKKTIHRSHGMLRLPTGKMSSRTGNIVTGEQLIEKVQGMVADKIEDRDFSQEEKYVITQAVAVGAVKYSILRQSVGGDIIFDVEKSISFEGDSGPYLQYSYVRAKSVLAKGKAVKVQPWDGKEVESWEPTTLEKLLYRFPEVVERSGREYQPHYIATYLTELAGAFNNWYAKERIVDANDPSSPYKVALTEAFGTVMQNGLCLLGIKVPERM